MIQIQLTPAQLEVAQDSHRYKIICAGRRFGKSTLARMLILQLAMRHIGLYWIVSPTYTQSVQNHWRELIREFPQQLIAKKYEGRSITLINGSVIELKGADNPDTLRGVKLRGLVVDEIASIRDWSWLWQEVLRATLTDYQAPAIFISTPKGYNHFYELFNSGQRLASDYKSWRFTSYDNPTIKKEEIDAAKLDLSEDVFAQEYMADFRKYTGLVYKEFDRLLHVRDLPEFQPEFYIRGLDRGYTNPTACAYIAVDKDGTWYQQFELYKSGLTTTQLDLELRNLSLISNMGNFEYETMDSAAAGDIVELNQLNHAFVGVVKQARESRENYVRWKIQKFADRLRVNSITGKPRYYVHPRCEHTIREFEAYSWPEKKDQLSNEPEQPQKLNDHCITEDTLVDTITFGQTPIKELVGKSGLIQTLGGVAVFSNVRLTAKDQTIIRLSFDNGATLSCTPDHLILSNKGWIQAKDAKDKYLIDNRSLDLIQSQMNGTTTKYNISRVSRQAVLQMRSLLAKQWSAFTQNSMGILQWNNSQGLSCSSLGSQQSQQFYREFRTSIQDRSSSQAWKRTNRRTVSQTQNKYAQSDAQSSRLAQIKERLGMAQKTRSKGLDWTQDYREELRAMWEILSNPISNKIPFLLRQMPNAPITQCTEIQSIEKQDVYNLEVSTTQAFSVNGGIIVHNCMDALADLNAMYSHYYEPQTKRIGEGKIPGTYIPASIEEDDANFAGEEISFSDILDSL